MAWSAFDTHKAVKELCGAGFDDVQAEAVVEQINNAFSENVATKSDVERLATREELREAVAKLATREELREAVAKLATREELEKLELRVSVQLEKQAAVYLRYLVAVAAGIVALSKALDLLVG